MVRSIFVGGESAKMDILRKENAKLKERNKELEDLLLSIWTQLNEKVSK